MQAFERVVPGAKQDRGGGGGGGGEGLPKNK